MKTCPVCSRPMKVCPADFGVRVFVGRRNQLFIDVTPEGLEMTTCYTAEGCGERLINKQVAETLDLMNAYVKAKYGKQLLRILNAVRRETRKRSP